MEIGARHWASALAAALLLHGVAFIWLGSWPVLAGASGRGASAGVGLSLELSLGARGVAATPLIAGPSDEQRAASATPPATARQVTATATVTARQVTALATTPTRQTTAILTAPTRPVATTNSAPPADLNAVPATPSASDSFAATPPSTDLAGEGAGTLPSVTGGGGRGLADRASHGSGSGEAGRADGAGWPGYLQAVSETVESNLRYARRAQRRGIEGQVVIGIVLDANGALRGARVRESSGRELLDDDALRTAQRAAPFPPPPPGLVGTEIEIPVDYGLVASGTPSP